MDRVGVVGAGIMGAGIAQVCAVAGLEVELLDVSAKALETGLLAVAANLDRMIKKGKFKEEDRARTLARIHPTSSYASFVQVDLVIEAATEK